MILSVRKDCLWRQSDKKKKAGKTAGQTSGEVPLDKGIQSRPSMGHKMQLATEWRLDLSSTSWFNYMSKKTVMIINIINQADWKNRIKHPLVEIVQKKGLQSEALLISCYLSASSFLAFSRGSECWCHQHRSFHLP